MNKNQFSEKWNEFKGKAREKWSKLADEDIAQIQGQYDRFCATLQEKYGWKRQQAEKEINTWCAACEQKRGHQTEGKKEGASWGREQSEWREKQQGQQQGKWEQGEHKKRKAG